MSSDYSAYLRELKEQGYAVDRERKHIRIQGLGVLIWASSSSSDRRAIHNLKHDIERQKRNG